LCPNGVGASAHEVNQFDLLLSAAVGTSGGGSTWLNLHLNSVPTEALGAQRCLQQIVEGQLHSHSHLGNKYPAHVQRSALHSPWV